MSVLVLITMTGCSTVHQMPPRALGLAAKKPEPAEVGGPLQPARWYWFRGYVDSRGVHQSVGGRMRAVAGDSLELQLLGSSRSLVLVPDRIIVPRDSILMVGIVKPDPLQTVLALSVITATLIVFIKVMNDAADQLARGPFWR